MGDVTSVVLRNSARAALIWFDDFLPLHLNGGQLVDPGPIGGRLSMRHKMNCGSFEEKFFGKFRKDYVQQGK